MIENNKPGYNRFLLLVAGLGGLLYGVDVGIIGGALPYLEATSGLNAGQLSIIVAAVLLGSVISTLFAGVLADWMGRKPLMVLSGVTVCSEHSRHRALARLWPAVSRPAAARHQRRLDRRRCATLSRRVSGGVDSRQRNRYLPMAAHAGHCRRPRLSAFISAIASLTSREAADAATLFAFKDRLGGASSGFRCRLAFCS